MNTEKYIPKEFTYSYYEWKRPQYVDTHSELSFITQNNKVKRSKDSYHGYERYVLKSSTEYKNEPSKNFKINSNHYMMLSYYSVVDGVMIEDERGFEFKISNGNFIQLARECTIRNGHIEDECVVGFDKNGRAYLVKVGSDFYKEAIAFTDKQNNIYKDEELEVGKVYRLKDENNGNFLYLGKHKHKSKSDTHRFDASVIQPKVPQHVFVYVYDDGQVKYNYRSAKVNAVQEEVQIQLKTDVNTVISNYKNSVNGRVIEKVQISIMSDEDRKAVYNATSTKYIVVKYIDGSYHLGEKSTYSSSLGYICPLDINTFMPMKSDCLTNHKILRAEDGRINNSTNTWYGVEFIFEDPLSKNM